MTERKPEKNPQQKKPEGEMPQKGDAPLETKGLVKTLLSDLTERGQKSEPEPKGKKEKEEWAEKEANSIIKYGEKPPELVMSKTAAENIKIVENHRGKVAFLLPENSPFPSNENVLQVLADISASGCEGQKEYLLVKAAQLRNAVASGADAESRVVMNKLSERVLSLYGFPSEGIDSKEMSSWSKEKKGLWNQINSALFESIGTTITPNPDTSEGWLDVKPIDKHGNPIDVPSKVAEIVEKLEKQGESVNWRDINEEYMNLGLLTDLTEQQMEYVNELRRNIISTYRAMNGNRLTLNPKEITKLTKGPDAARERDRAFYERIKKVLENPDEETHRQMNLYDEADLDTLMGVFGESEVEVIDPISGERKIENIGQTVTQHYENLKSTIMRLSDADYWARQAVGDVENLSKMMGYFENKFAIEAISDPVVEDMIQCMELSIKFIRDNNDGYIPQELIRHDPHTHRSYVDDLTIKFFRQRLENGGVRDYVRDPKTGIPVLNPATEGRTYLLSDKKAFADLSEEERHLRELASLRLAKGIGVLTNRTLELYAFTRVPGVDSKLAGGQQMPVFSSTAYEGLTRYVNPMQHWFLKYKFGDTLHLPFFNALLNLKLKNAEGNAINWTMDQYKEAIDLAGKGDVTALEDKFGSGASRIADLIEDFSFSGRLGPLSMWGLKDSTIDWTAEDFERLGGSVRLTFAPGWADDAIKSRFFEDEKVKHLTDAQRKEAWLLAKKGEGSWGDEWKKKLESYEKAYKTYIWTQYVMRNPLGVASQLSVDYEKGSDNPSARKRKLRSQVIEEIFSPEDTQKMKLGKNSLCLEKDLATTRTLTFKEKAIMERISFLEGDIASVMRIAMNSGQRPRDILESDFDVLRDQKDVTVKDAIGGEYRLSGEERYRQAKAYWKKVQEYTFGQGTDVIQLRKSLCDPSSTGVLVKDFRLSKNAESMLPERGLIKDAISSRIQVHAGTEDVQWSYLDLNTLGDRNWNRRSGDFLTRAKTVQLMMGYFNELKGKPKIEDLVKLIGDIGRQEKNHDPKEAAKFASLFAIATANVYRQRHLAGIPLVGRMLPFFGIEMSNAQKAMGIDSASYWSMNNLLKFADLLAAERVIPNKRILDGDDYGAYSMKEVRKNMGSSKLLAITEMAVIGLAVAAIMTSISAATTSLKEEEK